MKTRINVSIDPDLADFARDFAAENRTTVADIVTQYFLTLKRKTEGESVQEILAHPAFAAAMEESQQKLRSGDAKWLTYDEVFAGE
jgi:hypothetical protein